MRRLLLSAKCLVLAATQPCGPPTNVRSWEWNGLNAEVAIGPFMAHLRHRPTNLL